MSNLQILYEFGRSFVAGSSLLCLLLVPAAVIGQDWALYDEVLASHVSPTEREGIRFHGVDYQSLGQDPRYTRLIAQIENYPVAELRSREQRLAFYINAYNIFAIKMVIDNYPLRDIRDVGSFFFPVWKKTVGIMDGRAVSLDEIEHEILRPMGEPRIHFAIVCASLSCPDLRAEAFTAEGLEVQLEEQTRAFLSADSKGFRLESGRAQVSQIFNWFEEDFDAAGGVEAFVSRYRELPPGTRVRANLPYNWNLNEQ